MAVDSISIRAGNGIFAAQLNKIIFKFFENDSPVSSTAIFISKRMTDLRIVQLEGLGFGIVEGIVVAVSSLGYFAAIGDGIVGVIQQGGASNDNRGLGTGNFIAAGDGEAIVLDGSIDIGGNGFCIGTYLQVMPFISVLDIGIDCAAVCQIIVMSIGGGNAGIFTTDDEIIQSINFTACSTTSCDGIEVLRIVFGGDSGIIANGDIANRTDGVAASFGFCRYCAAGDGDSAIDMEGGGDFVAVFVSFALCGAVIGDGDGAAGEGGIAANLDGGNTIGFAGGSKGAVRYGEVAFNLNSTSSAGRCAGCDFSAINGQTWAIRSSCVIGYTDGTDGKGAGAGDGEALLRGYDGGKGAGALEDQGAVGGGSEFEGACGSAVKGDCTILIAGDGAAACSPSFAILHGFVIVISF